MNQDLYTRTAKKTADIEAEMGNTGYWSQEPLPEEIHDFRQAFAMGTISERKHRRRPGLAVGLDCFSPALTWMVGQDLSALNP